jgi:hypothetical protein
VSTRRTTRDKSSGADQTGGAAEERITTTAAWQEMERQLAVALRDYREKPDGGRWGATQAIMALVGMLWDIWNNDSDKLMLLTPLSELVYALLNLDGGVVAPMLQPKKADGRRSDSVDRNIIKIEAAVTMSILMERGFERDESAKAVAGLLRDCGIKFDERRRDLWERVAEWRDQMNEAEPSRPAAFAFLFALTLERYRFNRVMPQGTRMEKIRDRALARLLCSLWEKSDEVVEASRGNIPGPVKQRLDRLINADQPRLHQALTARAALAGTKPGAKPPPTSDSE